MKGVNRHMITLARESRGLNQREFAQLIDMSNSNIGKIENGDIGVTQQNLQNIATETDYPLHFFLQPGEIKTENLIWKKRRKVAQKFLVPIHAKANIITRQIQVLNNALHIPPPVLWNEKAKIKDITPKLLAQKLVSEWGIKNIADTPLLRTIEDRGIIIRSFDFQTSRIDGLSMLTDDRRPVIFLNSTMEGDRQRFTLAYELGLIIMHSLSPKYLSEDIPHDCNAFAAELLMPEIDIRKDFDEGITLANLAVLKKKWKVSMISLLYRADDLGYLTANQKRYILQQFNEARIRRHEPEELRIPPESPRLMKFLIGQLRSRAKLSVMDTAALLCLQIGEFMETYS